MHRSKQPLHHPNLRVERWQRRWIFGVLLLSFASGAAWLVARYFLRSAGQFGESVNPIEPYAIKTHGAAAMLVLFFAGTLLNGHVRRALKAQRNRASGWMMIVTLLVLVLTGFGLYYLAGESDRAVWSAIHWIVGLVASANFIAHLLVGRATRPEKATSGRH